VTRTAGTWIGIALGIVAGLAIVTIAVSLTGQRAPSSPGPTTALAATASLAPSTTGGGSATPATAAPTPPTGTPPGSVVMAGAGDIASCTTTGDSATADLLEDIDGTVFTVGDAVYPDGTARQFRDCYGPSWGRFLDRTRPVPGNHEYRTPGAAPYFDYFGDRAGDPAKGYYAYDLGAWRVYALNSNCAEIGGCGGRSPQVAWLKADLTAHPADCVLAYWHDPRFSSGRHGGNPAMDGLWGTLYDAGAEIVVNGHDHLYERFAPQGRAGRVDEERGIVEFVVGTGGFTLYEFHDVLDTSRARNSTTFGVLELTLSPGAWSTRFVPVAGQTFTDSAAGTCH
jgi:hypothetical protein